MCGGGLRKIVHITNDVIEGVGAISKGSDDTMKALGSLAALRACDHFSATTSSPFETAITTPSLNGCQRS